MAAATYYRNNNATPTIQILNVDRITHNGNIVLLERRPSIDGPFFTRGIMVLQPGEFVTID